MTTSTAICLRRRARPLGNQKKKPTKKEKGEEEEDEADMEEFVFALDTGPMRGLWDRNAQAEFQRLLLRLSEFVRDAV